MPSSKTGADCTHVDARSWATETGDEVQSLGVDWEVGTFIYQDNVDAPTDG